MSDFQTLIGREGEGSGLRVLTSWGPVSEFRFFPIVNGCCKGALPFSVAPASKKRAWRETENCDVVTRLVIPDHPVAVGLGPSRSWLGEISWWIPLIGTYHLPFFM